MCLNHQCTGHCASQFCGPPPPPAPLPVHPSYMPFYSPYHMPVHQGGWGGNGQQSWPKVRPQEFKAPNNKGKRHFEKRKDKKKEIEKSIPPPPPPPTLPKRQLTLSELEKAAAAAATALEEAKAKAEENKEEKLEKLKVAIFMVVTSQGFACSDAQLAADAAVAAVAQKESQV